MKFRSRNLADPLTAGRAKVGARRRWKWLRRSAVAGLVIVVVAGLAAVDRMWIRAEGLVVGESTAVSAIAQARIVRVHAKCLDVVAAGAPLAEVENEVTWQSTNQELSRLRLLLAQAKAQIEIFGKEAQSAHQLYEAQVALRDRQAITLKAQEELARSGFVAPLFLERARADLLRSEAETQAARLTHESKLADQARARSDAVLYAARIVEFQGSPEMMGRYTLRAPKAGILTRCQARPGEVVEDRQPLYEIFNPSDAYVLVYFRPADAARIAPGKTVTITSPNVAESFAARVVGAHPERPGLPPTMSRYFWQDERWSQYTPMRLDFSGLTAAQQSQISAGMRVDVSIWEVPEFARAVAGAVQRLLGNSATAHAAPPAASRP
jgi:multidrug resistance efflux pump